MTSFLRDQDQEGDDLDRILESAFEPWPGEAVESLATKESEGPKEELPKEPPLPEQIGRHDVKGVIGQGGMGIVLRAHDPELDRDLAIKLIRLRQGQYPDPEFVLRFLEEAKVSSQLQHPGIVPVYDVGRAQDGRPYFSMKLVEGDTLRDQLEERESPELQRQKFLEIFEKVCQTVAYAHARGVVHRDLKPENVMVGAFGEVQVMDWGIAQASASVMTKARIVGTPAFMSPEQAVGELSKIDARTDVFNLGGILCEILTGAPPYLGESKSEVLLKAAKGWIDDAEQRLWACGAEELLVGLARRCMAKEPEDRPQDAAEVAGAISGYLTSVQERARALEIEAAQAKARAAAERKARTVTLVLAAAILFSLLLAGGGYLWLQGERLSRREENQRIAVQALARAELLQETARLEPLADLGIWKEALVAARQAEVAAATWGVPAELLGKAKSLVAELEKEEAAVRRDLGMLSWLDDSRPHLGDDRNVHELDSLYAKAFLDYGLDMDRQGAETIAERIHQSSIRLPVAKALDEWAYVRRRRSMGDEKLWQKLVDIAALADPDPWRNQLRQAIRAGDRARLLALAREPKLREAEAETLDLLARSLLEQGERKEAIAVYRTAHLRHPEDFWISHNLVAQLLGSSPPPWDEIVVLISMAVAVRPQSAHAMADLGNVLSDKGDLEQARAVLERALEIDPDYARSWLYVGVVHARLGEREKGIAAFRRCIELRPTHREANRNLVLTLLGKGSLAAGVLVCKEYLKLQPGDAMMQHLLGHILLARGWFQEALAPIQEAIRLGASTQDVHYDLGRVFNTLGYIEKAVDAYGRALALDPKHAEAHCNLGQALGLLGRFRQAVAALEKGHKLGTARQDWSYPSADWLGAMRRMLELVPKVDAYRQGEHKPEGGSERALLAEVAYRLGQHETALRLFTEAFAEQPSLRRIRFPFLLYHAACAAALVSKDRVSKDRGEKVRGEKVRDQALVWLQEELAVLRESHGSGSDPLAVAQSLAGWLTTPVLAPVRLEEKASVLGASEREKWKKLWDSVETLLSELRQD